MDKVYAVLLAGGLSERYGQNKLLQSINGKTPLARAVEAVLASENRPEQIVIAASAELMEEARRIARERANVLVTRGGDARGESTKNALAVLGAWEGIVAIHDAARCLLTPRVFDDAVDTARQYGCGVAAIPVRDTLRDGRGAEVSRAGLYAVQTPQAFDLKRIRLAYEDAFRAGLAYTDDLGVWLAAGHEAHYSKGDIANQKLTYPEDMPFFSLASAKTARMGMGEDTHRLVEGRRLILGGVDIPFEKGLLGHSDADALTHAIIDALLGAVALGDIGRLFPDTDARYQDIRSLELLEKVAKLIREEGFVFGNVDATVTAERPKLAPHIDGMRQNIADALACDVARVNVKATTAEGMNDEGRGLCITARAVCALYK